jgi:4-diphosphocytidyl-2-C-methyl-D-erythritol kinase
MPSATCNAYAKINLGLLVLARRPDGFHDLETIFHRVALHDTLTFHASDDLTMESSDGTLPADDTNLCLRAARMLRDELRVDRGVHVRLEKRIPIGAGLGGGSADAAAVLTHLPGFWGRAAAPETLAALALRLGSDVPYFLGKGSACGRARGEQLEYFELTLPFWILLCNPGIHVATGWAYGQITPAGGRALPVGALRAGDFGPGTLRQLTNDFEEPVFRAHPEIRTVKEAMLQAGAGFALMSGSGSTVYGLFRTEEPARAQMRNFLQKGWRTFMTPPGFQGE